MTASKASKKRKGCWVCGMRFIRNNLLPTAERNTCKECLEGMRLLEGFQYAHENFYLIVDGAFMTRSGERDVNEPGFGGAGLVLVEDGTDMVVATRACGFAAAHSAEAEFQAIVRGARWIPRVTIFSDSQSHAERARGELGRDIRFFKALKKLLVPVHDLAHDLSVEGRLRFSQQATEPENGQSGSRDPGRGNSDPEPAV